MRDLAFGCGGLTLYFGCVIILLVVGILYYAALLAALVWVLQHMGVI